MPSSRAIFVSTLVLGTAAPALAQAQTTPPASTTQPPPLFSPPQGIRPTDKANQNYFKPQDPVNGFFSGGMTSPFGSPQDRTFYTPVGPPGAKANVFDQPSTAFILQQQQLQQQRPGFWQRVRALFGLGQDTAPQPGTLPQQQLPPGSIDPKVFGGR
jgi:hypothetical protein